MPDTPATVSVPHAQAAEELFSSIVLGGSQAPYGAYHRLRATAPVLRVQGGALVLTRYDDCDAALRHRSLGKAREPLANRVAAADEPTRRALAWMRRTMLFSNPPDHTRLRRLVSSAFTVRHVDELQRSVTGSTCCLTSLRGSLEPTSWRPSPCPFPSM